MNALVWGIVIFGMAAVLIGSTGSFVQMWDHMLWKDEIKPEVERLTLKYDRDGDGRLSTVERGIMGANEGHITFEYTPGEHVKFLNLITTVCGAIACVLMCVHGFIHRDELRVWVREMTGTEKS